MARALLATLLLLMAGAASAITLVDVAVERGLDFTTAHGDDFPGFTDSQQLFIRTKGNGAAVGDYDDDGDLDVYLLAQLGLPNRLFRNDLETGTPGFTDVTPAVLADTGMSRIAHFVDLDGDGDRDLLLVNDDDGLDEGGLSRSRVFRNDGPGGPGGSWMDVSEGSGFRPTGWLAGGAAVADYDGDGRLDVFVGAWRMRPPDDGPNARNGLYRSLGGLRFERVTEEVLPERVGLYFGAVFADFDGDHRPDLYVARDGPGNAFFWNRVAEDGSTLFEDDSAAISANHTGNDMGMACQDVDDDGDLDLYITKIADPDNRFGTSGDNGLYLDAQELLGFTFFDDAAERLGVEATDWAWGTQFVDLENDGDLDIAVVNGFDEFLETNSAGASSLIETPGVLFRNDLESEGSLAFTRLAATGFELPDDSRGLVAFDYDRDGDRDLLVTNIDQPVRLYENRTGEGAGAAAGPGGESQGHWLGVALAPDAKATGATVRATLGGRTLRRDVIVGRSFMVGTPAEVHFGLGDATTVDVLEIEWPDGRRHRLVDVAGDRMLRLFHASSTRPAACPDPVADPLTSATLACELDPDCVVVDDPQLAADANGDGAIDGADYTIWADHFGAPGPDFEDGDFDCSGEVDAADYTIWADHEGEALPEVTLVDLPEGGGAGAPACGLGFELAPLALMGGAALRRRRGPPRRRPA